MNHWVVERGGRMSRQVSEFQYKAMSLAYRGKEVFKPLNTGWIAPKVITGHTGWTSDLEFAFACTDEPRLLVGTK